MPVWRVLDEAARLVQRSLERTFVPVALVLCGTAACQVAIAGAGRSPLVAFFLIVALGLLGTAFAQALQIEDARRMRAGDVDVPLRRLIRDARRRVRTLVAAQLLIWISVSLIALICLVGAALFVAGSTRTTVLIVLALALVPAGILILNWSFVPALVVVERRSPLEALHASSGLAGRRLRLLAAYVIAGIACWAFVLLVNTTIGLVLHGTVKSFIYYVSNDVAWVVVMTAVSTAAYYLVVGTRRSDAIGVAPEELDRWAAVADRKRSSSEFFRL